MAEFDSAYGLTVTVVLLHVNRLPAVTALRGANPMGMTGEGIIIYQRLIQDKSECRVTELLVSAVLCPRRGAPSTPQVLPSVSSLVATSFSLPSAPLRRNLLVTFPPFFPIVLPDGILYCLGLFVPTCAVNKSIPSLRMVPPLCHHLECFFFSLFFFYIGVSSFISDRRDISF